MWPAWIWLLITGAALLGTFGFGVTKRAFVLEKERVPKITISEPLEDYMPWEAAQSGRKANHFYYLKISSNSSSHIRKCSVQDIEFENNLGHVAPAKGRHMRLRTERLSDSASHTFTREFDLRGIGDSVEIDICSMKEEELDSRVIMYYATTPTDIYPNAIVRDLFPHYLTISVTAENLPTPETRKFKIYVGPGGDLRMDAI